MATCDSLRKGCCAVFVFVPAILFNLFVLMFPLAGVVMIVEGDVTAGIITIVVGTVFFLGSVVKTLFPLLRVFFDIDLEDIMYNHCVSRVTCCGGCCIESAADPGNAGIGRDGAYRGANGTISFADGSGRIFTISNPRINRVNSSEIPEPVRLPVPPLDKSKNSIISECTICYEEHRKIAFVPCGHVLCEECVGRLDKWECHACRQTIKTLVRLYRGGRESGEEGTKTVDAVRYVPEDEKGDGSVRITMDDTSKLCHICHVAPPSSVLSPCGHVVSCDACAQSLEGAKCPECNIPIESVTAIFL